MSLFRHPFLILAVSFFSQYLSAQIGNFFRQKRPLEEQERSDFGIVITASLTLLGLIIGFSFAMAISRYDQRKNYEEAEANAIGTEYLRADALPVADAGRVRELLKDYTDLRVLWYTTRDTGRLGKIDADTAQLQKELWATVQHGATLQPTPIVALGGFRHE